MRSNKAILYRFFKGFHSIAVNLIWKSQCTQFSHIGIGSGVCSIPYVKGYEYIWIGDEFFCGNDVRIEAWDKYGHDIYSPNIHIGDNVKFTDRVYLSCMNSIQIGNGVLLGRDVYISDNSHGDNSAEDLCIPPVKRKLSSKGPVIIHDNVWIGRQVSILSGVEVGEGSVIGANSVVVSNIPPYTVAAGAPAKVIKKIR